MSARPVPPAIARFVDAIPSQLNILIDGSGTPRLSDFGTTSITKKLISINAPIPNYGGTIRWAAPEFLNRVDGGRSHWQVTHKSDVYALSMVIVEVRSLLNVESD